MENENKELLEKEEVVEEVKDEQPLEVVEEQPKEEQEEQYVGKEVTTSIRYDYRTMKYFNMYNVSAFLNRHVRLRVRRIVFTNRRF